MNKKPVCITDDWGTVIYYLNGRYHREDGPAIIHPSGDKEWYLNGELHREDGPAVENTDGHKEWFINGKRHREDGPAVEHGGLASVWYLNNHVVDPEVIADLWLAKNVYCIYNPETNELEFD